MRGDYRSTEIDSDWRYGTAYIVETREHENLATVIENAIFCLPDGWRVMVFCSTGNHAYVVGIIAEFDSSKVSVTVLESGIGSLDDYNELLFSSAFWQQFETENLLGFQVDSLINPKKKEQLKEIAEYDYVGAPWSESIARRWNYIPLFGGNGGICFSKRSARLYVLANSTESHITAAPENQKLNEDIWFSLSFKSLGLHLPSREIAQRLFVESVYSPMPFGVHKAWCYLPKNQYHELITEIPELEKIRLGCGAKAVEKSSDKKSDYRRFLLKYARTCLKSKNYYQADLALQVCQSRYPRDPVSYNLQAQVAYHLSLYEQALVFVDKSLQYRPTFQKAVDNKKVIEQAHKKAVIPTQEKGQQYLLINSWGSGLGFDLLYLLQQLLLAELTHRQPVIYWGNNSLYNESPEQDCFTDYFDLVSTTSINALIPFQGEAFPTYWQSRPLTDFKRQTCWRNKVNGQQYKVTGLEYLGRRERLLISGEFTSIKMLLPWIGKQSDFYGLSVTQIYRRLMTKYIQPKKRLIDRSKDFVTEAFKEREFAAIHLRGTDKNKEKQSTDLALINQQLIAKLEQEHKLLPIFVMTDDVRQISVMKERFGERVFSVDVTRSETDDIGVHHSATNKQKIAEEVIVDMLIGAKATHFYGCGFSYLACCVAYLRTKEMQTTLLPYDVMTRFNDIPQSGQFGIEL